MSASDPKESLISSLPLLLMVAALLFSALACNLEEEPLWTPETPKQYTAETAPVEVYVLIDEAGNVVDFENPYAYGVTAQLRYVLRFWDVGGRGAKGYEQASISKAYTPIRITAIQDGIEEGISEDQKADIYARSSFPTTEEKWADLTFSDGPQGSFMGTNPDTGKQIFGHMKYNDQEREMGELHVIFTEDIKQDYLVMGEEVFYNWP